MSLRELLEQGIVRLALNPAENDHILSPDGKAYRADLLKSGALDLWHKLPNGDRARFYNFDVLESLDGYTVPLLDDDYPAKTPSMWNRVYQSIGMNCLNITVVASPHDDYAILSALSKDPKYMGGGAGVGHKEKTIEVIKSLGG